MNLSRSDAVDAVRGRQVSRVFARRTDDPTRLLGLVPFVAFLVQAVPLAVRLGVTVDEQVYLDSGRSAWLNLSGVEFMRFATGPLHQLLGALPAVVVGLITGRQVGLASGVVAGRLVCLTIFGLGTLWAADRLLKGKVPDSARIVSVLLLALSPTFVAHASLMTTDIAFVATGLAFFVWLERHPRCVSPKARLLESLWFGLAFSAKQTAVVLLVPLFILDIRSADRSRTRWSTFGSSVVRVLNAALGGLVFSWALSFWSTGRDIPWGGTSPVPLPAPVIGFLGQLNHSRVGHMNFLHGSVSNQGSVSYFPIAWVAKSTPVELVLVLVAAFLLVAGARKRLLQKRPKGVVVAGWWATYPVMAAALVFGCALMGNINNGVRIVLFAMVVASLASGSAVVAWLAGPEPTLFRRRSGIAVVALLVCGQLASAVQAFPANLAYFSPLTGGRGHGYELLSDSNLDWGQDYVYLPNDQSRIVLDFFGVPPSRVGITARPFDTVTDVADFDHDTVLVVSSFRLLVENRYLTAELRSLKPDRVFGSSLFGYKLDTARKRHAAVAYLVGLLRAEGPDSAGRLGRACASAGIADGPCRALTPTAGLARGSHRLNHRNERSLPRGRGQRIGSTQSQLWRVSNLGQ